jgi:hypothetical protein
MDQRPLRYAAFMRRPLARVLVSRPKHEQLHSVPRVTDGLSADTAILCAALRDSEDDPQPNTTFHS